MQGVTSVAECMRRVRERYPKAACVKDAKNRYATVTTWVVVADPDAVSGVVELGAHAFEEARAWIYAAERL